MPKEVKEMFKCPVCEKNLSRRDLLKRHLQTVHHLEGKELEEALPPRKKSGRHKQKKPAEIFQDVRLIAEEVLRALPNRTRLKVRPQKKGSLKSETWLLEFSDLHYGLRVKSVEVGGLSEYNTKVAEERLSYLAETIIRILEYYPNKPRELVIALLGDMIDNSVMRGNQQASVEFGAITQTMLASELVTDFIVSLSRYFPVIRCYGIYGNHGRLTRSPIDSHPAENFDSLVYYIIKDRIKKMKNISLEYTEAQHMIIKVNDWKFWLEHGDSVRSWMGIPFYGSQREKARIGQMLSIAREQADYTLMGHHHNRASFDGIFLNGAFVGGDIYSIGRLRRMSIPTQVLLGVNKSHGVIWERPIQLIDKPQEMPIKIYE
jgi:uncharacterized C2H2 Zn-finger protein